MAETARGLPEQPISLVLAISCTLAIANMAINLLPLVLAAVMNGLSLNEQTAGIIASAELLSIAICASFFSPFVSRYSRRRIATLGCVAYAFAQLLSVFIAEPITLALVRVGAGIAAGFLMAVGNAEIAAKSDPDRFYGKAFIAISLITAASFYLLPGVEDRYSYGGVFACFGLFAVLTLFLVRYIPADRSACAESATDHGIPAAPAIAVLLTIALMSLCEGLIWSFAEVIAVDLGYADHSIGLMFASATLIGLATATFAVWLGTRIGRLPPLVIGISSMAIACLLVNYMQQRDAFLVGVLLYSATYPFLLIYALGTAAALDSFGRVATLGASLVLLALGVAPAVAGFLATQGSFQTVGMFGAACAVLSLVVVWSTVRRMDRGLGFAAEGADA